MGNIHIFWDNSNIHYVGLNHVFGKYEPKENSKLYRTYFEGLLHLAHRGRTVGKAYMVGSIPPANNDLWTTARKLGIKVDPLERTRKNKENAIDITIQAVMLGTAIDNFGEKDTFVVLTGDGAGKHLGIGFIVELERIKKLGHDIEVIAWETCCNGKLIDFAKQNGSFIALEPYYQQVTFIEGKRRPKPFNP